MYKALANCDPLKQLPAAGPPRESLKIRDSLKPGKLSQEFTPLEFRQWKDEFKLFFNASRLHVADIGEQRGYLSTCLSTEILQRLKRVLFIVYCYRRASAIAEGDDTEENVFSQGPLGKPPRHYTILAQSTRSRYTRNMWPGPLMGYLWG